MSEEELREIMQEIMKGTSLRKAAENHNVDRKTLKRKLEALLEQEELKKAQENHDEGEKTSKKEPEKTTIAAKEFRKKLKENHGSSRLPLDKNMENMVIAILNGKITETQAHELYHIDRETIRRNIHALAQREPKYLEAYLKYCNKSKIYYANINFKGLIVHMLKNDMSQSEMAEKYGISPRKISREIAKLSKSSDSRDITLYKLAKICADKKMKKEDLTEKELIQYRELLDSLFPDIKIIEEGSKSDIEREIEQLEGFCDEVQEYKAKGMTQEEIAKAMKTSISTIRRKKLKLKELKARQSNQAEKEIRE